MSEITVLAVQAYTRDDAQKSCLRFFSGIHREGFSYLFGTVPEVVGISVASRLEIKQQIKRMMVVDGLMQFKRLEREKTLAVYADGNLVVEY